MIEKSDFSKIGGDDSVVLPDLTQMLSSYKKPLLAFSAGVDSSALFHLLLEQGVTFAAALVNYHTREESDAEESGARELCDRFGIEFHVAHAPSWSSGFEAKAREFRYAFFESLVESHGYDLLLTAHHLNDRMEWMLMRLVRGAGVCSLAGMRKTDERVTEGGREYTLCRPLLECDKKTLLNYLHTNGISYFEDGSNKDFSYERNRFRSSFSDELIAHYSRGILRSFRYLERECSVLESMSETVFSQKDLRVVRLGSAALASAAADRALKGLGYCLSASEREVLDGGRSTVAGRKWAIDERDGYLFISPFLKNIVMSKEFKERCRRIGIPPKVRPYCFAQSIDIGSIEAVLKRY